MNSKSDIGAKSAWKGFSSQTLYIAYRLMVLEDKQDLYPETVEDLMIKHNNEILELIQIKNLSKNLSLSDMNPKGEDSFFKRVLKFKSKNIIIKVVSFGNVGIELEQLIAKNTKYVTDFKKKMIEYGYIQEDIEWIIQHLYIEKVREEELEKEIFTKLKRDFKMSIASNIIYDNLINYISRLSRNRDKTNIKMWKTRVEETIKDINSIKGMQEQYGRTIINLSEYKTNKPYEELIEEYRMGVDAKPDHIRNNLDIYRKKWIEKIDKAYKNNNIVILKGISGQGKSTIAYRYLLDYYSEDFIFVIEHIIDLKQAEDIVAALNGLCHTKNDNTIIYIDISPYDTNWKWILEELNKRKNNLKILITVREEDFRRTNINYGELEVEEIEITFEENEAREIYKLYGSDNFLNFEDAWNCFGGKGPLMEFMYMLNEKQTLEEKLNNQIDNIIDKEYDSDNWLKFLLIVSYIGKENFRINLQNIANKINSLNLSKMLKNLQKEYLIRVEDNKNYIISTHALRAELLVNIITQKIPFNEIQLIIDCLQCTDNFCPILIVKYLYNNMEKAEIMINELSKVSFKNWSIYATIIRSLLWADVYKLYIDMRKDIEYGNKLSNDTFVSIFVQDITGYINNNREEIYQVFKEINPIAIKEIKENINFEKFKISYYYTDLFIKQISNKIENKSINVYDNFSNIGYVLFWLANRQIYIKNLNIENLDYSRIEEILDFMVGLQKQNLRELYLKLFNNVKESIIKRYNILFLEESECDVSVKFINKIYNNYSEISSNDQVMNVIYCFRRLFLEKDTYNVQMIGTKLTEDIVILDTEKHIKSDKLPLLWITNLNRQFMDLDDYTKRKENWLTYKKDIDEINNLIFEYVKKYNIALDYFYRRRGNIEKLQDSELVKLANIINQKSKNIDKLPKCNVNKYGINNSLESINLKENRQSEKNTIEGSRIYLIKDSQRISKLFFDYICSFQNFVNQKDIAFLAKMKNEENNNIRLSIYNLNQALENLLKYHVKYKKLFNDNQINEKLYNELRRLSAFWDVFLNEDFRYNKSKLYEIKIMQKNKDREFQNYISENLNKYLVTIEGEKYYGVDIFELDKFINDIYIQYIYKFPNPSLITYNGFLMKEYQLLYMNKIKILLKIDNKLTKIGSSIKPENMLYCNTGDELIKKQIPESYEDLDIPSNQIINEKSLLYNSFMIVSKIEGLKLWRNYIISVNNEVVEKEKIYIDTYESWCNEVKEIVKEEINEILNMCDIIFKEVNKNKKYIPFTAKYRECLVYYMELSEYIVQQNDINEFWDVDFLKKQICEFIDTVEILK